MHTSPERHETRRRRLMTVIGVVALGPLALTACGSGVTDDAAAKHADSETVTLSNCGRELNFEVAPTAIVGLMPSQTELLLRLGVGDQIVGQAQVDISALPDDIAAQAESIPVLSTDTPPSREDLLAVAPDFVVSPTEYEFTAEQGFASLEQLSENGAAAYVATGGCAERRNGAEVTDLFSDIVNLGEILRVSDAADALVAEGTARLQAVRDAIADESRPTVAQVYVEGNTIGAIGAGVEADIIQQAGGENVFDANAAEFDDFFAAEINPEEIIERNPDAIVFGVANSAQEDQVRDYLRETFPDVPAVRNDVLIAVPQSDLYPGTLGNITAVETIASGLYPDAF